MHDPKPSTLLAQQPVDSELMVAETSTVLHEKEEKHMITS